MQLTRAADYAVRVMVHLASLPAGVRVSHADLAVATAAPESFLSKVLQVLARTKLIVSRRGAEGGFELVAPPETTTLLDVVEAVEGPLQLNKCLEAGVGCERQGWCAAHDVWAEAQEALKKVLGAASIAQLAAKSAERRTPADAPATDLAQRAWPVPGIP
jgi:Rrf2 family protein